MLHIVDQTVSRRFGADERSSPVHTLASEHTDPLVPQLLVRAEHERDLTSTSTNIASGDIGVFADVAAELGHEGVAKAANLAVGLSLGVKVGATLAATHGEAGECILECLFEAEELEDGEIDGRVKAETAFVRTEGGVVLHRR